MAIARRSDRDRAAWAIARPALPRGLVCPAVPRTVAACRRALDRGPALGTPAGARRPGLLDDDAGGKKAKSKSKKEGGKGPLGFLKRGGKDKGKDAGRGQSRSAARPQEAPARARKPSATPAPEAAPVRCPKPRSEAR
ncbi:MAG: hypothetical protein M5U28_11910 [Sandaracinaceae bacterium]|nr:hypothetical protein [Sandaracinaceae bacterium]